MLNFRQIEIFRAVMIAKTVSGAAQMLNTSQPGLSRTLKHLEDRLGFALFNRATGRLVPTQEALVLFDEVRHVYKNVEQLEHVVRRLAAGEDRVFRLGAPPSLGHALVPGMLKALRGRFRTLSIHFDILPIEQVVDYLVFERGEYALTYYHVEHPGIASEPVGEARMVLVVPAGHRLAGGGPVPIAELEGESLISFQGETPHGQIVRRMFARAGVRFDPSTFVRFGETAVTFIEQDLGVALVDEFTARRAAPGAACVLELQETDALPIFLNRSRPAPRSAVSDAFETLARGALGQAAPAGES
jgi:DNA-binding transcriptional LysR family regulator